MIKNVIFDIDGTLWDSTEVAALGWRKAAEETGYSKVVVTGEILKKEFGLPMNIIADHVFYDLKDEEKKAELLALCCKYEDEFLEESYDEKIFPGIIEEIKKLAKDYRLFIVSNCQIGYIELVMGRLGITELIEDHLCFGETHVTKGETMKILMDKNGLDPKQTAYVGDTAGDKEATEFAGAVFVYAAYGFGQLPDEPYAAESPNLIGEILHSI